MVGKYLPLLVVAAVSCFEVSAFAQGPRCTSVFQITKGHPFDNVIYPETALKENIPATAMQGSLISRRQAFLDKYKDNAGVVKDVYFSFSEGEVTLRGMNDVLVISLHNAPVEMRQDFLNFISQGTLSFPLGRRGGHLYTRLGDKTYDNISTLQEKDYAMATNHRIETVVQLSPLEFSNVAQYIANVKENRSKVIGDFKYDGSQQTKGKLDDNLCLMGGHNCTSWVSTAGIGKNGERLLELMGGKMNLDVGTNPGWWSLFLNTRAKKDRVPFTIFWTTSPLQKALAEEVRSHRPIQTLANESGKMDSWDFYPH